MAKLTPESAWEFADAIKAIVKPQTTRRKATVQNVDKDGTIWVNLPGSSTVTPIQSTGANVSPGDTVLTELRGTSLHITENQTNPAIGENTARSIARQETQHAEAMAKQAQTIADEAQAVAEATNQHFFTDDNGAHITDVTQDEWTAAVADEFSDYDPTTKPYHNQLLNSLGILLRTALNNLVSITRSAIAFYDGQGNAASNIVARFGSDGYQVGVSGESRVVGDYRSFRMFGREGSSYLDVRDLRDASGVASLTAIKYANGSTSYFTLSPDANSRDYQVTIYDSRTSYNDVTSNFTLTKYTAGVGISPTPPNDYRIVIKYQSESDEAKAFTFGRRNTQTGYDAIGGLSAAFGNRVSARGDCSFAAGSFSDAVGDYSVALGIQADALGQSAVALGNHTVASGASSHAQNASTIAASFAQTSIGKFNVEDANRTYALIIGNGTADNARSNALAVTWNGDIETATDTAWITLNGTIKYRIHHGVCYVCGDSVSGGTSVGTSGTNVGTLPVEARPSVTVTGAASTKSNAANGQFSIDSSGVITVWNLSTSSPYWCFTAAFPVG